MKVNVVSNLKSNKDTTKIKKNQFKTDLINLDLNNNFRKESMLNKNCLKIANICRQSIDIKHSIV